MNHNLNFDKSDSNYILLKEIFKIIDLRKSEQIIASQGIKNIKKFKDALKILFISIFFGYDVSFVINQVNQKKKLQKEFNISNKFESKSFYEYIARYDAETFLNISNLILNSLNRPKKRGKKVLIVDATSIQLDINFLVKKYGKEYLDRIGLKWAYSKSKGFYIGFKATLMMDHDSAKPVCLLIHNGSPNDTKIFDKILEKARKSRVIRQGDIIIFDKGYYSYKNYAKGILKYKIVPFIFPKEKFNPQKLESELNYPLEIFNPKNNIRKEMRKFQTLKKALFEKLSNWKKYKPIRGKIEDFFKLCKEGLSMKKIHRYTRESVFKHTILNVFLAGLITALGYNSKTDLQRLSEY